MSIAGLLHQFDLHYLDHIAPLCSVLKIPLIVNDEQIDTLAKKYYPDLDVVYISYELYPKYILTHFQTVISCLSKPYLDKIFFFYKTPEQRIWCPHGQSDKEFSIDVLKDETALLAYGPNMKLLFQDLFCIQVGNYRKEYFQSHLSFYKPLMQKIKHSFEKSQPTVLYAPTWEDYEMGSSYPFAFSHLLKIFPDHLNLIVKLHPNTLKKEDFQRDLLQIQNEKRPNILFLDELPTIYPLLELSDIYIGDTSSIGYDFIQYEKPRYFLLKEKKQAPLLSCGDTIVQSNLKDLCCKIQAPFNPSFYKKGVELYHNCFQSEINWREKIWNLSKPLS